MHRRSVPIAALFLFLASFETARAERALVLAPGEDARRALRSEARVERELRGGAIVDADAAKLRELSKRGYSVRVLEDPRRIHLAAGTIEIDSRAADLAAAGEGVRPWLVALDGPGRDESVARIASLGTLVGPVPPYGWLVRVDSRKLTALAAVSGVVGLAPMRAAWKVDARVEHGDLPDELSVVGYPDVTAPAFREVVAAFGTVVESGEIAGAPTARLRVLPGVLEGLAARPEVQWIDRVSRGRLFNNEMRVVLQTERAHDNANQAFYNPVYNIGVQGYDQLVAVTDSGYRDTHEQFQAPCFTGDPAVPCVAPMQQYTAYPICGAPNRPCCEDETDHGTAVANTFAGNSQGPSGSWDTANGFDGVAFRSRLIVQDFWESGASAWCLPFPGYIGATFLRAYNEGARVHNASFGHNIWPELDPVDQVGPQSGRYRAISWGLDNYVFNHPDSVVVYAAGNTGADRVATCPPSGCFFQYHTRSLSDEAQAKNVITVGASRNGAQRHTMYTFGSRGPTNDCTNAHWTQPCTNPGRIKPDVLAPGSSVTSGSDSGDTSYRADFGTSYAAPGIAGAAALVRDYFAQEIYPTESSDPPITNPIAPSAALIKAMLINSTVFLQDSSAYAGNALEGLRDDAWPNYDQGYGRPALDTVLEPAGYRQLKVFENSTTQVATSETWERLVTLRNEWQAPCSALRVTLVWTDPPPAFGAGRVLVNDLDLEVVYAGQSVVGNQGLIRKHLDPSQDEAWDRLNNVEDVFIPLGQSTSSSIRPTIRVHGSNVPVGTPQRFAVVATYGPCFDRTPCNGAGGCYAGPGDVVPGRGAPAGCPGQEYSDDECIAPFCEEEPYPDCDPPEPPWTPVEPGRPILHGNR